jgi:hypothetical protein
MYQISKEVKMPMKPAACTPTQTHTTTTDNNLIISCHHKEFSYNSHVWESSELPFSEIQGS